MAKLRKKRTNAPKCLPVIIAIVYVYATIAIHFHHTCHGNNRHHHTCDSASSGYCNSKINGSSNVFDVSLINHTVTFHRDFSNNKICPACLFSAKAKSTVLSLFMPFLRAQRDPTTELLPESNSPNLFEWLSAISLRAPPVTHS